MKGCLKLGGDPVLDRGSIELYRNISEDTVVKIIEKYKLKEFKVDWPLMSWPKPRCMRAITYYILQKHLSSKCAGLTFIRVSLWMWMKT